MGDATWSIEVDTGSGWTDITAAIGSPGRRPRLSRTQSLHRRLKSTVNTCGLSIHDETELAQIVAVDGDVPLRVTKDSARWFTGMLRDRIDDRYSSRLAYSSLEAVDESYGLRDKIDQHLGPWVNYRLCRSAVKSTSLFHQLLYAAGVDDARLDLSQTVSRTIARYAHDRQEESSWQQLVDDLLGEYGYVVDVDAGGTWRMHDLFPLTVTTQTTLTDADLERRGTSIRRRRDPQRYRAVRVDWYPHRSLDDQVLFRITDGGTEELDCYVEIDADEWYPPGTDDYDVYSVFEVPDGYELIAAHSAGLDWSNTGAVALTTETYGATRALLEWRGGAGGGHLTKAEVTGTAVVRDKLDHRRTVAYREAGTTRIETVDTKWLVHADDADRLASGRAKWYAHGSWTYRWESEGRQLGEVYRLDSDMLGVDILIRIVAIQEDEWGRQRVTAEQLPGTP